MIDCIASYRADPLARMRNAAIVCGIEKSIKLFAHPGDDIIISFFKHHSPKIELHDESIDANTDGTILNDILRNFRFIGTQFCERINVHSVDDTFFAN